MTTPRCHACHAPTTGHLTTACCGKVICLRCLTKHGSCEEEK